MGRKHFKEFVDSVQTSSLGTSPVGWKHGVGLVHGTAPAHGDALSGPQGTHRSGNLVAGQVAAINTATAPLSQNVQACEEPHRQGNTTSKACGLYFGHPWSRRFCSILVDSDLVSLTFGFITTSVDYSKVIYLGMKPSIVMIC